VLKTKNSPERSGLFLLMFLLNTDCSNRAAGQTIIRAKTLGQNLGLTFRVNTETFRANTGARTATNAQILINH
jgi:hypothetical protein